MPLGATRRKNHRGKARTLALVLSISIGPGWVATSQAQGPAPSPGEPAEAPRPSRLGPAPGTGANSLGSGPGGGEELLEGRLGAPGPRFMPDPLPMGNRSTMPGPVYGSESVGTPGRKVSGTVSTHGLLALPTAVEDEGPADGLTLDQAIDRLLRKNLDLVTKAYEIPQAESDVLTAGLRANPILYSDVQLVPYGSFSANRPGGQTQYDLNISYPFDVSGKRQARTLVASRAKRVIQAQFQDAVRVQIDSLYNEFVDILASRETINEAKESLDELIQEPGEPDPGLTAPGGRLRLEIQREAAEVELTRAMEQSRADLQTLGAMLRMTPAESNRLQIRGTLHDNAPPPASVDALLRLALCSRPDLVSFRLGLGRAEADVNLALANRFPDLFVLYQPYTFQNNAPTGRKSAHSWGVGLAVPLPVFNRNQGNIQRARLNVAQSQAELSAMEDQVVFEVRQAERFYSVTRAAVIRIERSLLPRAKQEHDRVQNLYLGGQAPELAFLTAERDYDQIVRQYRDALVQHRRSMLKLNTAVGQRVLP